MLIEADGVTRTAWALRDPATGHIHLGTLCEEQEEIYRLRAARRIHQPHDPHVQPVAVLVTVTEALKA